MKFQDSSFNGFKVTVGKKSVTHPPTHPPTHAPKAIAPSTFSKLGGIINYDGLESPMLHTKFRGNQPAGSGEEYF